MAKTKTTIQHTLTVQRRSAHGTRPTNRLRQEGLIPGVVYGKDMQPLAVTMIHRDLTKLLRSRQGEHALVTLRLDDASAWEKPVLVKVLQYDPVDGHVLHVDFIHVFAGQVQDLGLSSVLLQRLLDAPNHPKIQAFGFKK